MIGLVHGFDVHELSVVHYLIADDNIHVQISAETIR